MKKIVGVLVIAFLVSTTINAQGNKNKIGGKSDFTPEQQATLQTKRMTLNLDLDKNQQEAVYELQKNQLLVRQAMRKAMIERKEAGNSPTSDELFQLKSSRLDRMQLHSNAMKKILTSTQFEKWEKFNSGKMKNGNKNMAKFNNRPKNCQQKSLKGMGNPKGMNRS